MTYLKELSQQLPNLADQSTPGLTLVEAPEPVPTIPELLDGRVRLPLDERTIIIDQNPVTITPTQKRLLTFFGLNPDMLITGAEMSQGLGYPYLDNYSISASQRHLSSVRAVLSALGVGAAIMTEGTSGYMALSSSDNEKVGIAQPGEDVSRFGNQRVEVNHQRRIVRKDGELLRGITLNEFILLSLATRFSPAVAPYKDLIKALSGMTGLVETKSNIAGYFSQIKIKLGPDDLGHPDYGCIVNVRNVGYRVLPKPRTRPQPTLSTPD